MKNKLILTSYGLTTQIGRKRIAEALASYDLAEKKIFLFHEPHYSIEQMLVQACLQLGFRKEHILLSGWQRSSQEVMDCDIYYCTEGNTFEVLSLMRERGLDSVIKTGFQNGNKIYIGASAGAAIAGVSIAHIEDFDRNFVRMVDFEGLGLFDGIMFPHYTTTELESYMEYHPEIAEKYHRILSVSNEGCVIIND